jgi:hypothetical protein
MMRGVYVLGFYLMDGKSGCKKYPFVVLKVCGGMQTLAVRKRKVCACMGMV